MRGWRPVALLVAMALGLVACAGKPTRTEPAEPRIDRTQPKTGGLYAPHLRDGGPPVPPDISRIPEPIPVPEPLSRYGNRSPYSVLGRTYHVMDSAEGYVERGIASWYGSKFHGRPTSSFEPYDMYKFTAAHKTLPLPSFAQVTNLENGRSIIVRVNDRGPFHGDRLIDLSYAAAVKLGVHINGTARVEVRALTPGMPQTRLASAEPQAPREQRIRSASPAVWPRAAAANQGKPSYLQVGSFSVEANARRLRDQLVAEGLDDVRLMAAAVGSSQVWRVRVGPLNDDAQVERLRQRLRRLGLPEPKLVSD